MAIKMISSPTPRYIGTASERAAMDPVPPVGSEFFESDTGLTYVFCGGTTWAKKVYKTEEAI